MNPRLRRNVRIKIQNAANATVRATDFTHPLYRYPASMSPALARELIVNLTEPGDTVLDPFSGGGTTAIESLANGRRVICSDLNSLANFITAAKALPVRKASLDRLHTWFVQSIEKLSKSESIKAIPLLTQMGKEYSPKTHGALLILRNLADSIPHPSARRIALLITLQVGKLCFDCRELPPSPRILIRKLEKVYYRATTSIKQYSSECYKWHVYQDMSEGLKIYTCSIHDLPKRLNKHKRKIALVLTSPPYPGTHVLYNRWQIHGRGETSLPYDLLHLRDGRSSSFYTIGDRKEPDNRTYFSEMQRGYYNLRSALGRFTLLAQVISFPDPQRQLTHYRLLMQRAGYEEVFLDEAHRDAIHRRIPNRKWYASNSNDGNTAREYIIIHRPR